MRSTSQRIKQRNFWFHKFEFLYYRVFKYLIKLEDPAKVFIDLYCGGNLCRNHYFGFEFSFIPTNDIGRKLFFTGEFEPNEINACSKLISKDSVVLDIGGNIGYHSLQFAHLANDGKVFTFEPAPDTFELLKTNCFHFKNIELYNIGVSESIGKGTFYVASDHAYSGFKDTGNKPIIDSKELPITDLDSWVSNAQLIKLDFIKIDVEGLEQKVINGMLATLKEFRPVVFIEISNAPNQNENPESTFQSLVKAGYDGYVFENDKMTACLHHKTDVYNYFFLPIPE
jgi:FkbM family methyltransferase